MDTGLQSLAAIGRFHQLPVDISQLIHEFGQPGQVFSDTEILQAAKSLSLRAKSVDIAIGKLENGVLPCIAKHRDGNYFIIAKVARKTPLPEGESVDEEYSFLIHDLREPAPRSVSLNELHTLWAGEVILVTRRQGLGESLQQTFDISWFIPSLVKYRKLFYEVLLASFFIQGYPI